MDFQFDQSQVPIIGSKLLNLSSPDDDGDGEDMNTERRFTSEGASLSPGVSLNDSLNSGWKRPQLSQVIDPGRARNESCRAELFLSCCFYRFLN